MNIGWFEGVLIDNESIKTACGLVGGLYEATKDNQMAKTCELKYLLEDKANIDSNDEAKELIKVIENKEYIIRKDIEQLSEQVMEDMIVDILMYLPCRMLGKQDTERYYKDVLVGITKSIERRSPEVSKLVSGVYRHVCMEKAENHTLNQVLQPELNEVIQALEYVPVDMDNEIKIDKKRIIKKIEKRYKEWVSGD